ncbi:glutamate-cysteine ligase family protein [Actinoplanes sp. NBC_00393]|uniref:carboxylate-amine ligase n=1 Tax=Actinoplanes sp. NBC_00393 TaxID=2975953 RepID=UPI002E1A0D52
MTSTITTGSTVTGGPAPAELRVGVTEEFLLLDPVTGDNVAGGDHGGPETAPGKISLSSGVCTDLRDVRTRLLAQRRRAATAAADAGARLVAIGATPVGEAGQEPAADTSFLKIIGRYDLLALDPAVCGMHVQVGVPDRELAVQVCNHLRVWLPVIQALTSNSPFAGGIDTGYASWRAVQLLRRPGVGPTPHFDTLADYETTLAGLRTYGVMLDGAGWHARLAPTQPAVEVSVGDVCTDVDDAVLVTALVRAAVATAVTDVLDHRPAPKPQDCIVEAAHWQAARDGLDGELVDLRLGRARPAWELIDEFFATVSPALLFSGDLNLVVDELARLRHTGDGAGRQRRIHQGTGDLRAVLAALAAWTTAG